MNIAMKQGVKAVLASLVCSAAWATNDGTDVKSDIDRISYAIGHQIGSDMKRVRVELNTALVARGIVDATKGTPSLLSVQAMNAALTDLKRKVVDEDRAALPEIDQAATMEREHRGATGDPGSQAHAKRMSPQGTENVKGFFDENAKKRGIVTLPSGVQYKVIREGDGKQPKLGDKVALKYRGALVNGTEFGASDQGGNGEPRSFLLSALVPGLREAVSHMKEGAEWQVFVPPHLGFDAKTPLFRKITVFDIQLASVVSD